MPRGREGLGPTASQSQPPPGQSGGKQEAAVPMTGRGQASGNPPEAGGQCGGKQGAAVPMTGRGQASGNPPATGGKLVTVTTKEGVATRPLRGGQTEGPFYLRDCVKFKPTPAFVSHPSRHRHLGISLPAAYSTPPP